MRSVFILACGSERADGDVPRVRLVRAVYGPELPEKLIMAAEHGLVLHLEKLEQENRVRKYNDRDEEVRWELVGTQRDTKV